MMSSCGPKQRSRRLSNRREIPVTMRRAAGEKSTMFFRWSAWGGKRSSRMPDYYCSPGRYVNLSTRIASQSRRGINLTVELGRCRWGGSCEWVGSNVDEAGFDPLLCFAFERGGVGSWVRRQNSQDWLPATVLTLGCVASRRTEQCVGVGQDCAKVEYGF